MPQRSQKSVVSCFFERPRNTFPFILMGNTVVSLLPVSLSTIFLHPTNKANLRHGAWIVQQFFKHGATFRQWRFEQPGIDLNAAFDQPVKGVFKIERGVGKAALQLISLRMM